MSTDKQIGQFHEQGYLVLEKLIDGEKLDYYILIRVNLCRLAHRIGSLKSMLTDNKIPSCSTRFKVYALLSRAF